MKGLLISLCLGIVLIGVPAQRLTLDPEWEKYKVTHGKVYSAEEDLERRNIWEENYDLVKRHNEGEEKGHHSFRLAINPLSDMTLEEVNKYYTGFIMLNTTKNMLGEIFDPENDSELPESVDWVAKNAVTPVKTQGICGSCWTFSTTGTLEGVYAAKTGQLVSLSEQNLMDCDMEDKACQGGNPQIAYDYILKNNGINSEESYPYEMMRSTCRFDPQNIAATLKGWKVIPPGDELALKTAVATAGPISVAIDASSKHFVHYSAGVYKHTDCSSKSLNHAVLAVGYGTTESGEDYWIIKNSWGETWGDGGYIRMARNKGNMCGIATSASFPVV